MKILAVSHLFPNAHEPRYGIFVARQLAAIAAEGATVELLVPRLYSPRWLSWLLGRPKRMDHTSSLLQFDRLSALSVRYFAFPGKSFKRRAGVAMYRAALAMARARHREIGFDIVYGTDWFLGADVARRLAASLGLPSSGLAIGDDINITAKQSTADHQRFVEIANGLTATLACGDSLAESIDEVRAGSATLSVFGVVDLDRFQPVAAKSPLRRELQLPHAKQILLYAGYLWKRKGLLELIDAFEGVCQNHDVALVICGQGEDEAAIVQHARQSDANSHIHFVGSVGPDRMHRYMQAADLFVLPSYSEGMPNAVMEAMACGLPVVCTAVGGLPQAVGDSDAARLIVPRDHRALETSIRDILDDEQRAMKMSTAARTLAEARFGARPNARRILTHFEQARAQASPDSPLRADQRT